MMWTGPGREAGQIWVAQMRQQASKQACSWGEVVQVACARGVLGLGRQVAPGVQSW